MSDSNNKHTKEELEALQKECVSLVAKLNELTEDELKEVAGGADIGYDWPYEKAGEDCQQDTELGSRQEVIGDWPINTQGLTARPPVASPADRKPD